MDEKTCPVCGVIYITRRKGQVFCSTSCRSKNIRYNSKFFDKKCSVCGKEYKTKASNSIYCSYRCRLDSIKIIPKEEKCSWCGKEYKKFKGKLYCSSLCKRLSKQDIRKKNMKKDINMRLSAYLRHFLYRAVKGKQHNSKFYLGYTVLDLRKHLEERFSDGMTWGNFGEWHIDHIRPLASFNFYNKDGTENIEEIEKAMCLGNLQPLWARDNISKGAKYAPKEENQ